MANVNFFLVFEGRAGSGLLRSVLNSSPEVMFEAEWMMFNLREEIDPARQQNEQVGRFFNDPVHDNKHCLGFANKLSDIVDPDGFAAALREQDIRVLELKRRNVVKQVVSTLNALRTRDITGKFHAYKKEDIVTAPFEIEVAQFDAHLKRLLSRTEALENFVRSSGLPALEIFYEDFVLHREAELLRVTKFLDLNYKALDLTPAGRPLKQTPTDLRDVVSNFNELRAAHLGTPFEAMFADQEL